jgi:pyridoxine kinase
MVKIATIAGSDASGGAGLEADLKTFAEYGVYGLAAVTVIATMDPERDWAHMVFPVAEDALRAQLATVFAGVGVAAAKCGMLGTPYAVELTREYISAHKVTHFVLDPVMVCKGANEPLSPELNHAIKTKLVPLAEVVTPNLFEAAQLAGLPVVDSIEGMKKAAAIIGEKGARYVFIKGGAKLGGTGEGGAHINDKAVDILYDSVAKTNVEYVAPLLKTTWNHGAGCTTSAAIAAGLAVGLDVPTAVGLAKKFITTSLTHGFPLNKWVGPGNPSAWRSDKLYGNAG